MRGWQPWIGLSAVLLAPALSWADPCSVATEAHAYTIQVDADGRFLHCRHGRTTDTPPVSGERVVLQLPKVDPHRPYRFRLVDPTQPQTSHPRRLFREQLDVATRLHDELRTLAGSPESGSEVAAPPPAEKDKTSSGAKELGRIAEVPVPSALPGASAGALREAASRRDEYLSVSNGVFVESVRKLRQDLPTAENAGDEVDEACGAKELAIPEGALRDEVTVRCAKGGPGKQWLASTKSFGDSLDAFVTARRAAHDALHELAFRPATGAEQDAAAKVASAAFQRATAAAKMLIDEAPKLDQGVARFIRALRFLQIALSIPASSVEGQPISLGRFSAGGILSSPVIYQVHVWREPSALFDLGSSDSPQSVSVAQASNESLVDRFQPIERRLFSLELALMYSGGLPDHPELIGQLGKQTLSPVQTSGFSAGVLASLEPLQFAFASHPWAALLRLPTLVVPFTLNPLTNYFIGGGIGWNDVGSINFGAHIALTTVPGPDTPYGTVFNTSPIELAHVTQPGHIAAGYFVSVSLDVLGIIHFFFQQQSPTVRDVYSGAAMATH